MQWSFSDVGHATKEMVTGGERFLGDLEARVPWSVVQAELDEVSCPPGGGRSGPLIGLARLLRMYVTQQCFGLFDERVEGAMYYSAAIRRFVGLDLDRKAAPDAIRLRTFHRRLENNELTRRIFEVINANMAERTRGAEMQQSKNGKAAVRRDEGAPRCGCCLGTGPQLGIHVGQGFRHQAGPSPAPCQGMQGLRDLAYQGGVRSSIACRLEHALVCGDDAGFAQGLAR